MPPDDTNTTVEGYRHGRVPRAVRERQILDVAEELFAERGFDAASMDELARRTGVSKPVIYDLVGSKEELFHRCFERAGTELEERFAAAAAAHAGDIEGEVRSTALAFFGFLAEHDLAWAKLFALDTRGRTEAALAEIRARHAAYAAERLLGAARELDRRRAEALGFALNGAYEAMAHWRREHPDTTPEELADWLVALVLPGIRALAEPEGTGRPGAES